MRGMTSRGRWMGAAVRVSLVCFAANDANLPKRLDGSPATAIHSDLTTGSLNFPAVRRLPHIRNLSFQGPVKVGAFDVDGATARKWLDEPPNPNGRKNQDVVRPWINGRDITRRPSDTWIIDFADRLEREAVFYVRPIAHVLLHVKPERDRNRDRQRRERWWQLGRSSTALRGAVASLDRFIATPRVAKADSRGRRNTCLKRAQHLV